MPRNLETSDLYRAMQSSGNYEHHNDILDALSEMVDAISYGADPEEVLHDEGFEPDYVFDLLDYCNGALA